MLLCLLGSAWAGTLTLHMLDVGQGDALLLTTPNGDQILVDAGGAKFRVADTLARMGIEKLDLVIATHPHADHIGGMEEIFQRIPVGAYYHSGDSHTTRTYRSLQQTVKARGIEQRSAKAGQIFQLGEGATMRVLWPGTMRLEGTRSDLNSNSVILRIQNGEDCMLLMGDAEEDTERAILRHNFESCELLKVAHHGSRYSSTQRFLSAVDPEIALISVGDSNRYRHPGEATLDKLHRMEVEVYRTDLTGHVTVVSTGHGLQVIDGLPDSAPIRTARKVVEGPVGEGEQVTPLIVDPTPPPPPPEEVAEVPAEVPDSPEDPTGKSVENSDEAVDPAEEQTLSSWQCFLRRLTFWKSHPPPKDSSE
jgi:beta-lactamase superfamily II metal-dependent hydrolase